jgi:hypothetical protein
MEGVNPNVKDQNLCNLMTRAVIVRGGTVQFLEEYPGVTMFGYYHNDLFLPARL